MSKFCIYVKFKEYLREWLRHKYGEVVTFPVSSNENAIIRCFIQRLPKDRQPELNDGSMTAIAIPDSTAKPPEMFNYIGERGKKAIREAVKDLFIRALWEDISQLEKSSVGLNCLIAAWCENNGIGIDRVNTVRQCYYRIRAAYAKNGINLRKSSRNRTPQ